MLFRRRLQPEASVMSNLKVRVAHSVRQLTDSEFHNTRKDAEKNSA
jgi:hypothetical protein